MKTFSINTPYGPISTMPVKSADGIKLNFERHNFDLALSRSEAEMLADIILAACSELQ